jgi:hypothetical protein
MRANAMASPSRRRRRWIVCASILAIVLFASLVAVVYLSDSAVEQVIGQLRPGMTKADVRRILADVFYIDYVSNKGSGYLFHGNSEDIFVRIEGDRVSSVERWPDQGPFWERIRRNLENMRRNWEQQRRNREQQRRQGN